MKIIKKIEYGGGDRVEFVEMDAEPSDKRRVLVRLKKMTDLMLENDYWFDRYGNFCTEHGQICPSYFSNLGQEFHVTDGCGWTLPESDWLKAQEEL